MLCPQSGSRELVLSSLSPFGSAQDPSSGNGAVRVYSGPPTSINLTWKLPHRHRDVFPW